MTINKLPLWWSQKKLPVCWPQTTCLMIMKKLPVYWPQTTCLMTTNKLPIWWPQTNNLFADHKQTTCLMTTNKLPVWWSQKNTCLLTTDCLSDDHEKTACLLTTNYLYDDHEKTTCLLTTNKLPICWPQTNYLFANLFATCLLRATVVSWGWNGYQSESQHRKLTLEKKFLLLLLQGFEPTTFQSWVQRSNHWAIFTSS